MIRSKSPQAIFKEKGRIETEIIEQRPHLTTQYRNNEK